MDDEWLESKNLKFDGKVILEPNFYILETMQPQYALMFVLG
jgi:hypothetical protein